MTAAAAKTLPPGGDTARRIADAVNQHAQLLNTGVFQNRTLAELANEEHEDGRSFYITDATGGACLAVSSLGQWLKISLGAVVS